MLSVVVTSNDATPIIRDEARRFAKKYGLPWHHARMANTSCYLLEFSDQGVCLLDAEHPAESGYTVDFSDIDLRTGPGNLSRKQPLAKAIGKDTQTVVDATAGLGHDAFLLACMGFEVMAVERSPVIGRLLQDGLRRALESPVHAERLKDRLQVTIGDAKAFLESMKTKPDVVYVDPMYPPKRKQSALAKKHIRLVRDIVGNDEDAESLAQAALRIAQRRVVVKRPNHAPPLLDEPDLQFKGKLVRYDVYLKHESSRPS
ncbi:MAG: class I SAM-dependent methyltransferase [Planctomycetota bacterium]|nr:class I SAM-dependent methyltransferase [Planctomycetota bacterium]